MIELIEKMMGILPEYTQDEAHLIDSICKWTDEQRQAFIFAKQIFDERISNGMK